MIIQDIRSQSKVTAQAMSPWGADAAMDVCDRVRHFRCPYGGTFGDMIDSTPKDLISKVMLEDKVCICKSAETRAVSCQAAGARMTNDERRICCGLQFFSTWSSGRTVLLGDGERSKR